MARAELMTGAELIAEERERQISTNGYDHLHDDRHTQGELLAGAWKVIHDVQMDRQDPAALHGLFVPCAAYVASKYGKDYIHRLVIGGALLAAEIDRLLRQEHEMVQQEIAAVQNTVCIPATTPMPAMFTNQPDTETEASIASWVRDTFPGADPVSPRRSLRCLEETIELCLACGASPNDIATTVAKVQMKECQDRSWFKGQREPGKIPGEAADVHITLVAIADVLNFRLREQVNKKMVVNRGRRWKANGDGTGYHIKPEWTPGSNQDVPEPTTPGK